MDLIPSINPDSEVPDFEDGDDNVTFDQNIFQRAKPRIYQPKAVKASKPSTSSAKFEDLDNVDGNEVARVTKAIQHQAPWSFKDTIAQIDATTRQSTIATSLKEKIAAVQKRKQYALAREQAMARQASLASSGAAGSKRKRPAPEDDEDDEIEEVEYEGEADDEDDDDGEEEENDEGEEEPINDAAEKPSAKRKKHSDAADMDEDVEIAEGLIEEDKEEEDDQGGEGGYEAMIAASKPNPHRQQQRSGDSALPKELAIAYARMFEPDPFASHNGKGTKKAAENDKLRELAAGKKGSVAPPAGSAAPNAAPALAALPSSEPQTWTELNLSRPLLMAVQALGYTTPTPIQKRTLPLAMAGHDVCGSAVTGSGKTAAYLLPILERLLCGNHRTAAIRVLVLVPTRELAAQVHSMAGQLSQYCSKPAVRSALVLGGVNLAAQTAELRTRPDIVIATPGRMLDHIRNSMAVHVDDVDVLVLDEADRLLEMGFEAEVQEIVSACPVGRQTLLFSATMTARVESLVKLSLRKPVRVNTDPLYDMAGKLVQEFVRMRPGKDSDEDREALVLALVTRSFNTGGVLIFTTHKRAAHRLAILLGMAGVNAAELHGNLTQRQRLSALEDFRTGTADVLVATDLAGRGLDIAGVRVVLNAQMPREMTAYVHRVGRTARAGRAGVAVSLVAEDSRALMREIVKRAALNVRSRAVPPEVFASWRAKLNEWEADVSAVLFAEREEREMRIAQMEVTKASNLIDHEDEIHSRPARSWFQSEHAKKDQQERAKDVLMGPSADGEREDGSGRKKRQAGGRGGQDDDDSADDEARPPRKQTEHRLSRKKRRRLEAAKETENEERRVSRLEAQAERDRKTAGGEEEEGDGAKGKRSKGAKGASKSGKASSGGGGSEVYAAQNAELKRARKRLDAAKQASVGQGLVARRAKAAMRDTANRTGLPARVVSKMMLGVNGGAGNGGQKKQRSKGKRVGAGEDEDAGDGEGGGSGGVAHAHRQGKPGGGGGSKARQKKRR